MQFLIQRQALKRRVFVGFLFKILLVACSNCFVSKQTVQSFSGLTFLLFDVFSLRKQERFTELLVQFVGILKHFIESQAHFV